jgi:hypothetical protein
MCPRTTIYVSSTLNGAVRDAPRHMSVENTCVRIYYICVLLHTTHTRLCMQRSRPHLANAFNILLCVLVLLYMCPRTTIYVSSSIRLILVYVCSGRGRTWQTPSTSSSSASASPGRCTPLRGCGSSSRQEKKKAMCPRTAVYTAAIYSYICVLVLLYMQLYAYTAMCVSSCCCICDVMLLRCVSSSRQGPSSYIRVLVLHMCHRTAIHAPTYVSSSCHTCSYVCVLELLHMRQAPRIRLD